MKNPFKKLNLVDTATNLLAGAGVNIAVDYAMENVDALASVKEYADWIKVGVGVLGGTMVSNKIIRQGLDGLATVGATSLAKSFIGTESESAETPAGLPQGTIGRLRVGQGAFRRNRRVAGLGVPSAVISK